MSKISSNNRGQSLIGLIIVLVAVGLIGGGLYYYFSKPIPEIPKIAEESVEEKVVKPGKEMAILLPEEEIIPLVKEELFQEEKLNKVKDDNFKIIPYFIDWGFESKASRFIDGHKDIAPERKTDPWNFDWQRFNEDLNKPE